jgi:SAM-dependent methyltransferase
MSSWVARSDETSRAFDGVAADYHRTNTANPLLAHMRARTMALLRQQVPPGSSVLDLGCGPGTDHPAMVAAGYRITAIDSSPEMVRQAQQRASALAIENQPIIRHCRIEDLSAFEAASFDAVFSNFGPLNCVSDLDAVAREIHRVLRHNGVAVASIVGRLCPWEVALFVARGDLSRAFVRLRRGPVPVPLNRGTVWTRYYSTGECIQSFHRAGFTTRRLVSMGLVAPPPYTEAFAARHPALVARLLAIDDSVGRRTLLRGLGDHFSVVMERR